jgi:5-formyltetrahydrofolate cyclo-ligase
LIKQVLDWAKVVAYYDRALTQVNAWKIGLVYAGELSSEVLPHEPHDVPLDAAATPSIVVRFNR